MSLFTPVFTYTPSPTWVAALDQGSSVTVQVVTVVDGFAFRLDGAATDGNKLYVNASGEPHATVEQALLWALQFPEYPDVAEYGV